MFKRFLAVLMLAIAPSLTVARLVSADEIGTNDFRISHMGPDGDTNFGGTASAVAYNSQNNEFFVVWGSDDNSGTLVNDEVEIFGQRVSAVDGSLLGARVRLSEMGADGSTLGQAFAPPDVAYDSQNNQYLVVWYGDNIGGTIVDNENEVWGQLVNAETGAPIGSDIRISVMGADGSTASEGALPSVAYNSTNNEFMVVWRGVDTATVFPNVCDIFGRRINASTGALLGSQAILRSPAPKDLDPNTDNETTGNSIAATYPEIAYNSTNNEYLIVFHGDVFTDDDIDVFGQRVNASTGAPIGIEFRISSMGNKPFAGFNPEVAYNAQDNQYLVVWSGDKGVNNETEVWGQRIDAATGAAVGTDDFRISHMGPDGVAVTFPIYLPQVAYNSLNNEYFVVWAGEHDQDGMVDDDLEVFSQRIDAGNGDFIGNMTRLSDLEGIGTAGSFIQYTAVAYSPTNNMYLVTFGGDDNIPPLVDLEVEIFGQLVTDPKCGNGFVEGSEACDDGNAVETDACLSTCVAASCGDGLVQTGVEECDGSADCGSDCQLVPIDSTGDTPTDGGGVSDHTDDGASNGTGSGSGEAVNLAPGGCSLIR